MKTIRTIPMLCAALSGCGTPQVTEPTQPPSVTILELQRNWSQYDNRVVRIRGQIDNCGAPVCYLCPEDMTTQSVDERRCITLGFSMGLLGVPALGDVRPLHRFYRFTTLTLDATFSSVCFHNEKGEPIGDVLCTGWYTNLYAPKVVELHVRKTVRDGLVVTNYGMLGPLAVPAAVERQAMLTELRSVAQIPGELAVFLVELPPNLLALRREGEPLPDGLGCICWEGSCSEKWPTQAFFWNEQPSEWV